MSERRRNEAMETWYPGYSERNYTDGLFASCSHHDTCDRRSPFSWALHGAELPHGPLSGMNPSECEAQEACDAAAVAWVLIALAKRAAQWAESIDAQLAREYRAAVEHQKRCWLLYEEHGDAHDAHHNWDAAHSAESDRLFALLRGWP